LFDSIDFELTTTVNYDDDTGKITTTYSNCPWIWTDVADYLYYVPEENVIDRYWDFSFVFKLTAISECTVTSFKINDIDVTSYITDQTQADYYKTLGFSMPITQILQNNSDLSNIPIIFDISFSQGSKDSQLYNTNSPMYLKLDGENHRLSFSNFTLIDSENSGAFSTFHQIPSAKYSNTENNEFITFPTKTIKNFKFSYANDAYLEFTFNSIIPINTDHIYKYLHIQVGSSYVPWSAIIKIEDTKVTCQTSFNAQSSAGVLYLYQSDYLLNSTISSTPIYQFNVTPTNGNQILEHKTGQIEAVDFIESEDNQILLQKGGRIWCKEFKEWDTAVLLAQDKVHNFYADDLSYNGTLAYDLQFFFGNIPTGTIISETWTLPSGLVSFKNNCILNWYSKTDDKTYDGYNIQLVLFNVNTTHRTYIDLSTATTFDNIIPDITATETEYATHAYLQLINNNTGITEDQVNGFDNILEIYYQEGSHVDINDINYNKDYSIICKELKEV